MWYQRKTELYEKVEAKGSGRGTVRLVARKGETPRKGMVSSDAWDMLEVLSDDGISMLPPSAFFGLASGGMSTAQMKAAMADMKEAASKKRPITTDSRPKKRPRHTERISKLGHSRVNSLQPQ